MICSNHFYIDIKQIQLAHEFTLDHARKCDYSHGRGSYGLALILGGQAKYRFSNGERITVEKGNVLFFTPDAAYTAIAEQELYHYTVNFDIRKEESTELPLLNSQYCLLREISSDAFEKTFRKLVELWNRKRDGYEMLAMSALCELLCLFHLQLKQEKNEKVNNRLLPAREYVEQHFDLPLTLEQLAYLSNMSVTNFRREWKKRFLESPIQYRDTVRMYHAKEFLRSGYLSVCDVAKKCGFEDASYFVRAFKQKNGMTPNQFKKSSQ